MLDRSQLAAVGFPVVLAAAFLNLAVVLLSRRLVTQGNRRKWP